jgi:hypothetical protein
MYTGFFSRGLLYSILDQIGSRKSQLNFILELTSIYVNYFFESSKSMAQNIRQICSFCTKEKERESFKNRPSLFFCILYYCIHGAAPIRQNYKSAFEICRIRQNYKCAPEIF